MDVERALLARVINDQSLPLVVKGRITPEFFRDDTYQRVYTFLLDHWSKYSQAPDLAVVKRSFPSYDWEPTHHSLDYLIDSIRERRERTILTKALQDAADLLVKKDDPQSTENIFQTLAEALLQVRMETTSAVDEDTTEYGEDFIDLLRSQADSAGQLHGVPTGFEGVNYATGGWLPEQFIVMMGLPKSLKSSVLLYMALHAQQQGQRALFLTFEMSNLEQKRRLFSLMSKVSLTKITNGTFNQPEFKKIEQAQRLHSAGVPLIFSQDIANAMTVSGVRAKILDYQPQIVFIDAAYLMRSEIPGIDQTSPAAMTDVARSLKQLSQATRIPIVVTVQASQTRAAGGHLNAGSAMYTQAWRQSADVLLGSERASTDEEVAAAGGAVTILLKVLASRSGPYAESAILFDWTTGFVKEDIAIGAIPVAQDGA